MTVRPWIRRLSYGAPVSALLACLLVLAPAFAETKLQPADMKIAQAVDFLAKYAVAHDLDVAKALEDRAHFPPPGDALSPVEVRSVPPKFLIQMALACAHGPGPDSPSLALALLSKALAEQDPSLAKTEELQPFLKMSVLAGDVEFKLPERLARPDLPTEARARIGALAENLRRPRSGGAIAALQRLLKLSPGDAVAHWLDAGALDLALEIQVAKQPEPKKAIAALISEAAKISPAILHDPVLRGPDDPPPPPVASLKPAGDPPPRPKGPDALDDLARQKIFDEFKKAEYKTLEDLPFEKMKGSMHGVGGILFGDRVQADPDLPRLKSVRFEKAKDAESGALVFEFADGSRLRLDHVTAEDAYVAYQMVYADKDWKPGQGVPLLGMKDNLPYYEFGEQDLTRGERSTVVMHPALHNTHLGWAGVMIDCLPRSRTWLLDEVRKDPELKGPEQNRVVRQTFDWLFDPWHDLFRRNPGYRASVYRIVDVPLEIRGEGGVLTVSRAKEKDRAYPESLRRAAFIEMHVIAQHQDDEGNIIEVKPFTEESYRAVPDLLQTSYEFRRLNNFAAVLAAVRWAKGGGADFAAPDRPEEGPPTPDAAAVTDKTIRPIPLYKPTEAVRDDLKEVARRVKNGLEAKDVVRFLSLGKELKKAGDASAAAEPGSDERKDAEKRIEELHDQMYRAAKDSKDVAYLRKLFSARSDLEEQQVELELEPLAASPDVKKYKELAAKRTKARDALEDAKPGGEDAKKAQKEVEELTAGMDDLAKKSKGVGRYRELLNDVRRIELADVGLEIAFLNDAPDVRAYLRLKVQLIAALKARAKAKPDGDEAKSADKEIADLREKITKFVKGSKEAADYVRRDDLLFQLERGLDDDKGEMP